MTRAISVVVEVLMRSSTHDVEQFRHGGTEDGSLQPPRRQPRFGDNLPGAAANASVVFAQTLVFDASPTTKHEMKQATFDAPVTLQAGNYILRVWGNDLNSRFRFDNQTQLEFDGKTKSVFIQTDKPLYKPGDLVRFRVVVVDADLKPLKGVVDIFIHDADGNLIHQWLGQSDPQVNGVVTRQLLLSDQPVLGMWKILAESGGEKAEKLVEIAEYVLPKFTVHIKVPPFAVINEKSLDFDVRADYTYGKPVDGSLHITAMRSDIPYDEQQHSQKQQQRVERHFTRLKSGKQTVSLPMSNLIHANKFFYQANVEIVATVTDRLTGIQRNATADISVYNSPYKIEIKQTAAVFKPGLRYTFHVHLLQRDGRPPPPSSVIQTLNITTGGDSNAEEGVHNKKKALHNSDINHTALYTVPADGVVKIHVHPRVDTDSLWIEAHLFVRDGAAVSSPFTSPSEGRAYAIVDAARSPSRTFLQLSLHDTTTTTSQQQKLSAPGQLQLWLNATEALESDVMYTVLSRGSLIAQGTWPMTGQRSRMVTLALVPGMAPTARIIASYVRPQNGEVVVDALDVPVSGLFSNRIQIAVRPIVSSAKKSSENISDIYVEPGDEVEVRVTSTKDSFVALAGIDQSVLLLRTGNDISQAAVEAEIATYSTVKDLGGTNGYVHRLPLGARNGGLSATDFQQQRQRRSMWSSSPSFLPSAASDASEILDASRVVVLTNAYVYKQSKHFNNNDLPVDKHDDDEMLAEESSSSADARDIHLLSNSNIRFGRVVGGVSVLPAPLHSNGGPFLLSTRRNLLESWLWANATTGSQGDKIFREKVPDTITSWIITGFAMNDFEGLGIVDAPTTLKVFRPFFISLNLPYSVVRGETIFVQIVVYNYQNERIDVQVSLDISDANFILVDNSSSVDATNDVKLPRKKLSNRQRIFVEPQNGATVTFALQAIALGNVPIKVSAISANAGDAVEKKLLVEPEGVRQHFTRPWLIDSASRFSSADGKLPLQPAGEKQNMQVFTIDYPPAEWISDSLHVEVSVIGDVMGTSLANIDKLLRLPTGCGEQNMLNFAPNIYITKYLTATGRLTPEIRLKAIDFARTGYQRQLTYKHTDSSFSAFGLNDPNGSTWLTAFILRAFREAQSLIEIDKKLMSNSLAWLKAQQLDDGSFNETGKVFYKPMQGGGSGSRVTLTAYAVVTLLENGVELDDPVIVRAVGYLHQQIPVISKGHHQPYALALISYALSLTNNNNRILNTSGETTALSQLELLALDDGDGKRFWQTQPEEVKIKPAEADAMFVSPQHSRDATLALDVETAAYALLVYTQHRNVQRGLPVLRWLISQRNKHGGFISTQDTVVGLQAMTKFAAMLGGVDRPRQNGREEEEDLTVQIKAFSDDNTTAVVEHTLKVSRQNALVLQSLEIPGKPKRIEIIATGRGTALAQLSWSYNVLQQSPSQREQRNFELSANVTNAERGSSIKMHACTRYLRPGDSNMAIMQIDMPTSFEFDAEQLQQLPLKHNLLQRVELADQNTRATLYFDKIGNDLTCVDVHGYPLYFAENLQNRSLSVYDYYEPSKATSLSYRIKRDVDYNALVRAQSNKKLLDDGGVASSSRSSSGITTCLANSLVIMIIIASILPALLRTIAMD